MCKKYPIATQAEIRKRFWLENPYLSRKKIPDFSGNFAKMHCADTRCAFVDYVDMLAKSGQISESLALRVTL